MRLSTLWQELRSLLTTMVRLLQVHWLPLLVIAIAGVAAHGYLRQLAIVLGRLGAVPGLLALALVPFSTLLALVGMLLVLRRRVGSRTVARDLVAAIGAVLLPFLVVYQSGGRLTDDMRHHMRNGFFDDLNRLGLEGVAGTPRIPEATSLTVLGIVTVAVLARAVTERVAENDRLWRDEEDARRVTLRILAGYCELVWIVLGAFVVTYALGSLAGWWRTRAVVHAVGTWWSDLSGELPSFTGAVDWLVGGVEALVAAAGTVLLVPLAWLLVGVLVYGIRVSEVISLDQLTSSRRRIVAGFAAQTADPRIQRSWRRISEPKGRFGVLVGAVGMLTRAGWALISVYCLLYVLITLVPYLVWAVARALLPMFDLAAWQSWGDTIESLAEVGTLLLSSTLLAAAADRLLQRFGAPPGLRLVRQRVSPAPRSGGTPGSAGSRPRSAPPPAPRPRG
ncbi:hypothetical protein [Ruania albidiflava]|uniref:hypothetical protein n=1 Tax=Ruania albidiflava TaxID=366586 RepID=UPI0003B64CD7|nr:hypothetical protein [Ruania albidiflava]